MLTKVIKNGIILIYRCWLLALLKSREEDYGRNHVNETARHGIIAHCLWEENLGNITKAFGNVSFRIVARTLSQKGMILNYYFLFWDRVRATKPKTSGNKPTEIVKFSSQRQWAMIPSLAVSFTWLRPLSSGNISNEMWHLYFCFVFAT